MSAGRTTAPALPDPDGLSPVSPAEHRLVRMTTALAVLTPVAWLWHPRAGLIVAALLVALVARLVASVARPDPWAGLEEVLTDAARERDGHRRVRRSTSLGRTRER